MGKNLCFSCGAMFERSTFQSYVTCPKCETTNIIKQEHEKTRKVLQEQSRKRDDPFRVDRSQREERITPVEKVQEPDLDGFTDKLKKINASLLRLLDGEPSNVERVYLDRVLPSETFMKYKSRFFESVFNDHLLIRHVIASRNQDFDSAFFAHSRLGIYSDWLKSDHPLMPLIVSGWDRLLCSEQPALKEKFPKFFSCWCCETKIFFLKLIENKAKTCPEFWISLYERTLEKFLSEHFALSEALSLASPQMLAVMLKKVEGTNDSVAKLMVSIASAQHSANGANILLRLDLPMLFLECLKSGHDLTLFKVKNPKIEKIVDDAIVKAKITRRNEIIQEEKKHEEASQSYREALRKSAKELSEMRLDSDYLIFLESPPRSFRLKKIINSESFCEGILEILVRNDWEMSLNERDSSLVKFLDNTRLHLTVAAVVFFLSYTASPVFLVPGTIYYLAYYITGAWCRRAKEKGDQYIQLINRLLAQPKRLYSDIKHFERKRHAA